MSTRLPEDIIPDNDQTRARDEHLREIEALVGNPYPSSFARSSLTGSREGEDTISSVVEKFAALVPPPAEGERPTAEAIQGACDTLRDLTGGKKVRVAGRLATPPRVMGKAAFVHLSDGGERLQIYVRRQDARAVSNDSGRPVEEAESGWKLFQLLDHGDFVGVEGFLFVTKTGELSVHVEQLQFLSKALVPMPDKLHGISDPEIRQRQRYADLIASSLKVEREPGELTTREVFERRSRMITQMRRYLDDHGYVEVETPILSPIASGAAAKPFETYHHALDIKLYARIAPELYLKRLLVGGFERVYELNRNFRNEGISYKHNPEFTMLEFYCAYMDATGMMDFCEEMLRTLFIRVLGDTKVTFGTYEIDFGAKFERLTMKDAISSYSSNWFITQWLNLHLDSNWLNNWKNVDNLVDLSHWWDSSEGRSKFLYQCKNLGSKKAFDVFRKDITNKWSIIVNTKKSKAYYETIEANLESFLAKCIEYLFEIITEDPTKIAKEMEAIADIQARNNLRQFKEQVRESLVQPTFITDFPKPISPLSKASPDDPAIAERFELYIAGMEVANGFSELNDPVEQYARFEEQVRQRERGDEEAMQMDVDYVKALSYGMPPAAGIGIGIDRLAMLLTNRRSIRDVILFPHMRPRMQASETTEETESERES